MALFRKGGLFMLRRTQSVPAALYHKNVCIMCIHQSVEIKYMNRDCDFQVPIGPLFVWPWAHCRHDCAPFHNNDIRHDCSTLQVIDHYENPRNVGSLDKKDESVGTGLVGAPACGDVMKLQIKVDENGKIIDAKFKTFGCGSAIASSSLATEWVKGKTIDEAGKLKNSDIAKELSLPPVKLHCSSKFWSAIGCGLTSSNAFCFFFFVLQCWPKMPSKQHSLTTRSSRTAKPKMDKLEEEELLDVDFRFCMLLISQRMEWEWTSEWVNECLNYRARRYQNEMLWNGRQINT